MMTHRRGFTLIELLAVISCTSIVAGLTAALLLSLMKVERAGRARLNDASNLARLAREFKRDAHSALALGATPDSKTPRSHFELKLPKGETAEYRLRDGSLVLTHENPTEGTRHDVFPLPTYGTPRLETEVVLGHTIVRIRFEPRPSPAGGEFAPAIRIEAVLGRDTRFGKESDSR